MGGVSLNTQGTQGLVNGLSGSVSRVTLDAQKIASGKKFMYMYENPADQVVGTALVGQISILKTVLNASSQAVSILNIIDSAMSNVVAIQQRQQEVAAMALSGSLSDQQRGLLDVEFQALSTEIFRIAAAANFNGQNLLDGTISNAQKPMKFQVDVASSQVISVAVNGFTLPLLQVSANNQTTQATALQQAILNLPAAAGTNTTTALAALQASTITDAMVASGTVGDMGAATGWATISAANAIYDPAAGSGSVLQLINATITAIDGDNAQNNSALRAALVDAKNLITAQIEKWALLATGVATYGTDTWQYNYKVAQVRTTNGLTGGSPGATLAVPASSAAALASEAVNAILLNYTMVQKTSIGALQSRFTKVIDYLTTSVQNIDSARAQFLDGDLAELSQMLAQDTAKVQASVAALAKLNQLPDILLSLIPR